MERTHNETVLHANYTDCVDSPPRPGGSRTSPHGSTRRWHLFYSAQEILTTIHGVAILFAEVITADTGGPEPL